MVGTLSDKSNNVCFVEMNLRILRIFRIQSTYKISDNMLSNITTWHNVSVAMIYRQVSNISRTLVGNKIVDNSDVVGASPVGAAPTTSSLST